MRLRLHHHIQLYWSSRYVKGGVFLLISSLIVNILNYLFNFFAARALGPSGYGELIAFYSYIVLFSVPMVVFSNIIIQRVGSHTANPYQYAKSLVVQFRQIIIYFIPCALFGLLVAPLIIRVTNLSPVASYLLIPTILLGFIANFYSSLFQGLKLFFLFSVLSVAGVVLKLLSVVMPIFKHDALSDILIFQSGAIIFIVWLSILIVSKLLRHHDSVQVSPVFTTLRRLMTSRQLIITFLSVLSFNILSNSDIMFVKKFFTTNQVGIYGSWTLFAKIILYIVAPIVQISFVFFVGNTKKRLQHWVLLTSLSIVAFAGLMGYVIYTSVGNVLVFALFGQKFLGVIPYLGLASIFGTFYTAINFLNTYFLAKKSRYALILIVLLPFYFIALFFFPKNIIDLVWTNIIFSALVTSVYFGAFLLFTRKITLAGQIN